MNYNLEKLAKRLKNIIVQLNVDCRTCDLCDSLNPPLPALCVTCLLKCTSNWYLDMDKGQYTAMIFVDLKKAFDTVNHEILLKKLEKYGVIGSENAWFASYLCNRRQFCRVNGVCSGLDDISCGVPLGSCLGPLLFMIHINDLPFSLQSSQVTIYADDTTLSHSSKNIADRLRGNKLSLNLIKTQAMVVGSRPNLKMISDKRVQPPTFVIDDSQIEIVEKLNIWEFNLISILFGISMLDMCVLKYLVP